MYKIVMQPVILQMILTLWVVYKQHCYKCNIKIEANATKSLNSDIKMPNIIG